MADDTTAPSYTDDALYRLALLTYSDLGLAVKQQAFIASNVWRDLNGYRRVCFAKFRPGVKDAVVIVQLDGCDNTYSLCYLVCKGIPSFGCSYLLMHSSPIQQVRFPWWAMPVQS